MATEFEQLRLSITLIDDASAGIRAVREGLRETTGGTAEYQKLIRENTQKARVYGDVVGHVDGRLVLLGGSVGFLSDKLDRIGSALGSQIPTLTAFAEQQQQANQVAQLLGMSIGQLKSIRSQTEKVGISTEDADKIAAASIALMSKLSSAGGRTRFQQELIQSGFRFDYSAHALRLSKARDYAEFFNIINEERRNIERYAIEKEGMDPELAREMGHKWLMMHGLPATAGAMEELKMPTKEYLVEQQRRVDVAEVWLKQAVQLSRNVENIKGKILVTIGPGSKFYEAMEGVVRTTKWLADNAEPWFWSTILSLAMTPAGLALLMPWMFREGFGKLWELLRKKLSKEMGELTFGIQRVNLVMVPGAPGIVPAAFVGGGTGTQGLPGWLQTPGGGGRLPSTPGTGTGSTPGTGTRGTPGTPSGGGPQSAPTTPGAAPRPAPTPGTGTGGTPGTGTGGTPGTPSGTPAGKVLGGAIDISGQSARAGRAPELQKPEAIITHFTGGGSVQSAVTTLNQRGLGYNYIVDRDGKIYQFTPTGKAGAHMQSGWGPVGQGLSNANTIGISAVASDEKNLTPIQIQVMRSLARDLGKQHNIPPSKVFGHGEVNPGHRSTSEGQSTYGWARQQQDWGQDTPSQEPGKIEPAPPHPFLGAQQKSIGTAVPSPGFGLPDVPADYVPKVLGQPQAPTAQRGAQSGWSPETPYEYGAESHRSWYGNLDFEKGLTPFTAEQMKPYFDPRQSDVNRQYGEKALTPGSKGWHDYIDFQIDRAAKSGKGFIEFDNADFAFKRDPNAVKAAYAKAAGRGLQVLLKNPTPEQIKDLAAAKTPDGRYIVGGAVFEQGGLSPKEFAAAREAAGRPDLPATFVRHGEQKVPDVSGIPGTTAQHGPGEYTGMRVMGRGPAAAPAAAPARTAVTPEDDPEFERPGGYTPVDRSFLNRSMGNEIRAKVSGGAKVDVDVSTPKKKDESDSPLKPVTVERQSSMEDSERGPSVEVD